MFPKLTLNKGMQHSQEYFNAPNNFLMWKAEGTVLVWRNLPILPRHPELEIRTRKAIYYKKKENVWKKWLRALTIKDVEKKNNIDMKHFVMFHFIDHIFILCALERWSLDVTTFQEPHIRPVIFFVGKTK